MNGRNDVEGAIRRLYEVRERGFAGKGKLIKVEMPELCRQGIIQYDKHLAAVGKVGKSRRMQIIDDLRHWATRYVKKPWKEASEEDIKEAVATLNASELKGTNKETMKQILKAFYTWLEGEEGRPPKKVQFLKPDINKYARRADYRQLINAEQVDLIVNCAPTVQEKLFLKMLWETAFRANELITLTISSLEEKESGMTIRTSPETKTGQARAVPIMESIPLLREHLKSHCDAKNPSAPLFYTFYGQKLYPWCYNTTVHRMIKITRRARSLHPELQNKLLNFHSFRKARLSMLAPVLQEQVLKKFAGWSKSSAMAEIYCDISGERFNASVLENVYGVKKVEREGVIIKIKTCPHCKHENDSSYSLCEGCNRALSTGDAIKVDQTMDELRLEVLSMKKTMNFLEERVITKDKLEDSLRNILREEITSKISEKAGLNIK